jgi:hypothetical protein
LDRSHFVKHLRAAAALGVALVIALAAASTAAASSNTPISSFSDPRQDMPSRPGQLVRSLYGPYTVPAAQGCGAGQSCTPGQVYNAPSSETPPCTNCRITDIVPNLVYADGTSANFEQGIMLHHMVLFNPQRQDLTCPTGGAVSLFGERFFAAGNERTALRMPTGFGYFVGDDPWTMVTEIMNHSEELKIVYVQLDATWRPAPDPSVKPVKPVWMDVADCANSEYHIPAGPSERTWTWTSTLTGRVVATAGHLHSGGREISLVNESTGRRICTSAARYGTKPGSMGSLDSMSLCAWDALGTVRAGEVLGIHAHYESPQPADDVMGIMLVYVHPTDDLTGGTAAPDSAREPVAPQTPGPAPGHSH